jgi:hypothetical protein
MSETTKREDEQEQKNTGKEYAERESKKKERAGV